MSRSVSRKKKKEAQKKEMIIIGVIAAIIVVVIVTYTFSLKKNITENEEKILRLENQIEDESKRAEELESEEAFMTSYEFIEKIARERLGLVSPNETIIKPDN